MNALWGWSQSCYSDFGPTLAAEKLRECHDVLVSVETLRRWMIDEELWVPGSQRARRVYQPRHRRSCIGELIQIDGCDHEWFEGPGTPMHASRVRGRCDESVEGASIRRLGVDF